MKILHVIAGLGPGGAETVLFRLLEATRGNARHEVISLADLGHYGPRLAQMGIPTCALRLNTPCGLALGFPRLLFRLRKSRPDVVQTWMYHADAIGGIGARLLGMRRIAWNIRHSNMDGDKWTTKLISGICAKLSRSVPRRIVCNSNVAADVHALKGYCRDKMVVVPNGYDLARFRPDSEAGSRMRRLWGAKPDDILVGMVARWHPQKDHANFLQAIQLVRRRMDRVRCVLVGPGMGRGNSRLDRLLQQCDLHDSAIVGGCENDTPAVFNALDVHVLSSAYGEAFPNVVAESMACGTPCVATDVGDAARIVNHPNWMAPPKRADLLAAAILDAVGAVRNDGKDRVAAICRRHIENHFALDTMANAYLDLWAGLQNIG